MAASLALTAPFLSRFARAAEITWRVGHSAPTEFPLHVRLVEAAGVIAARSGGQMLVEVHPNNELGSLVGLLAQLRAGTVDLAPLTGQILAKDLTAAELPMVGFAFAGYNQLWPAIDGGLGTFVRAQFTERLGLVAMDTCWDFGFRQITTSGKHVETAANMAGLKLRTPPEGNFIEMFQALKALPVAMPLRVVDQALRSHSIDGQESVVPLVKAAGLSDVLTVCALTNHVWDGQWLCVSGKSWAKLPPKLQDIVAGALNESGLHQREDTASEEAAVRQELEASGMTFNAVDQSSFRAMLRRSGYYAARKAKMGDDGWATLQKYAGGLT